jgi:hypothetical protein
MKNTNKNNWRINMMEYKDARIRNLKMKIVKSVFEDGFDINSKISDEQLKSTFFFKEKDVLDYKEIFVKDDYLEPNLKSEIENYLSKVSKKDLSNNSKLISEFEFNYLQMTSYYKFPKRISEKEYDDYLNIAIEQAKVLHWEFIPIFDEQFILNREIIPEKDLHEYYNHFHAIEDLYRWINGDQNWKSTQGDLNLDIKMKFRIYSSRWGHDDYYQVHRTTFGWVFSHLSYQNVECSPDATGRGKSTDQNSTGLFAIFNQDSIQVELDGVKYAFEVLWKMADETEMSVDELQTRLNEISDWLEQIEKAIKNAQPSWVGYY